MLDVVSHDAVELVHRDGPALAARLALAGLGGACVVAVAFSLPGPQRHCLAARGLLSCHRSVGSLLPAVPARSFAKLRSDKKPDQAPRQQIPRRFVVADMPIIG